MTLHGIYIDWKHMLWGIGWTLYFVFMAACFWFIVYYETPSEKRAKIACDLYVSTLINSDDIVEITRANAMIEHLNCRVHSRLP